MPNDAAAKAVEEARRAAHVGRRVRNGVVSAAVLLATFSVFSISADPLDGTWEKLGVSGLLLTLVLGWVIARDVAAHYRVAKFHPHLAAAEWTTLQPLLRERLAALSVTAAASVPAVFVDSSPASVAIAGLVLSLLSLLVYFAIATAFGRSPLPSWASVVVIRSPIAVSAVAVLFGHVTHEWRVDITTKPAGEVRPEPLRLPDGTCSFAPGDGAPSAVQAHMRRASHGRDGADAAYGCLHRAQETAKGEWIQRFEYGDAVIVGRAMGAGVRHWPWVNVFDAGRPGLARPTSSTVVLNRFDCNDGVGDAQAQVVEGGYVVALATRAQKSSGPGIAAAPVNVAPELFAEISLSIARGRLPAALSPAVHRLDGAVAQSFLVGHDMVEMVGRDDAGDRSALTVAAVFEACQPGRQLPRYLDVD